MLPKIQMGLERCLRGHPNSLLQTLSTIFRRNLSGHDGNDDNWKLPTRRQQLKALKEEDFDVLVIGGGAIGCGCALDAASRGLKTALIEAGDFGNGASCKSSKLVEGGSSYLQAAIQGADLQQIYMLQQVLTERATMLRIAPHLNRVQPMLMPIYSPLRLPFYWLGLKLYDAMAGMANVRASHFLSQEETLNEFPLLRRQGLLGSLVYYDGQMDDARMCLALALTAIKNHATAANYVKLHELMPPQDATGCRRAVVEDTLTESPFIINSRCLINATGAGTDVVRKLDDCKVASIALPKVGTHMALPSHFGSPNCGLLFPSQQLDEQTMFMLPFENRILVGSVYAEPEKPNCFLTNPKCEEIDYLLEQTREVLDGCALLRPDHVLSAWTGVSPSIMCPRSSQDVGTKELVPNFLVEVSGNQMITLAGGRWSSYRVMASDAIDAAIEHCNLEPQDANSCTHSLLLDGAEDYYSMLHLDLVQNYDLPMDVAHHLAESYGCNAFEVLHRTSQSERQRLHPQFPYIKAEVDYACQREYACHVVDVIARRLRVAFVDASAAFEMLPTVLQTMSKHLCWDESTEREQFKDAQKFLMQQMGLGSVVKYNPQFKANKKGDKAEEEKHLAALNKPACDSCEYRRILAKASTTHDIGNILQKPIPVIAVAKSPGIQGTTTSMPSDPKETSAGVAGSIVNNPKNSASVKPVDNTTDNLKQSQTGNIIPGNLPCNPDAQSNTVSNRGISIAEHQGITTSEAVANSVQIVPRASARMGDISIPAQQPKDIAKHVITGAAVKRKLNQGEEKSLTSDTSEKDLPPTANSAQVDTVTEPVQSQDAKAESKEELCSTCRSHVVVPAISASLWRHSTAETLQQDVDTAEQSCDLNVPQRGNTSSQHLSKKTDSKTNLILTQCPEAQLAKKTTTKGECRVPSSRGTSTVPDLLSSDNASVPDPKRNTSDQNCSETFSTKVKVILRQFPEAQPPMKRLLAKECEVPSNGNATMVPETARQGMALIKGPERNTSERNHVEMSPAMAKPKQRLPSREQLPRKKLRSSSNVTEESIKDAHPKSRISDRISIDIPPSMPKSRGLRQPFEAQPSKSTIFLRKIRYPRGTKSTLDIKLNVAEANTKRPASGYDKIHVNVLRKTPAMRLQSLLYKDKHFERQDKEPCTRDPMDNNLHMRQSASKGTSAVHYLKGKTVDSKFIKKSHFVVGKQTHRLVPRKGLSVKENKDSNTSKTFNQSGVNPKLKT